MPRIAKGLITQRLAEGAVVYNPARLSSFPLDESQWRTLQLCDGRELDPEHAANLEKLQAFGLLEPSKLPALAEGLVLQSIGEEMLAVHPAGGEVHLLNKTAALVATGCREGREISELGLEPALVSLGLERLQEKNLLRARHFCAPKLSRRQLGKLAALAAIPALVSVALPAPAQAVSCLPPLGTGGCTDLPSARTTECLACCPGGLGPTCMSTFQVTGTSCLDDNLSFNRGCRTSGSKPSTNSDCTIARMNPNGGFYDCCVCT